MMRVLLVRHGHTDVVGHRLVSRLPGVVLSDDGRRQARALGDAMRLAPLAAVYASPLERARETAAAIAAPHRLAVGIERGLHEIDFGDWTGLTFDELAPRAEWRAFNERRASADVPRGERAADVQARIVATLRRLARLHDGGTIAAVSHADVIRAAVLHCTGTSLDRWATVAIDPASVTTLDVDARGPHLVSIDEVGAYRWGGTSSVTLRDAPAAREGFVGR